MNIGANHGRACRVPAVAWLALALALVPVMPTNQSLWIDEAFTAKLASVPSLSEFAVAMMNEQGSEPQMPLAMLSFWAGARLFGSSEIGLRTVSACWAALAVVLMWWIGRRLHAPWLAVLLACHPFFWYFAGEARPYSMAIAMGTGLLGAAVIIVTSKEAASHGLSALLLFGTLLSATTIIGVIPFLSVATVVGWHLLRDGWRPGSRDRSRIVLSTAVLTVLGTYYLWTMHRGVATGWSQTLKLGAGSFFFSGYELLGLFGFGPGRYELRTTIVSAGPDEVLRSFVRWPSIGLAILGALLLIAAWRLARHWGTRSRWERDLLFGLLVIIVLSTILLFAVSILKGFTFWGRHVAALLPFIVLAIANASRGPEKDTVRIPSGVLTFSICLLWLASSLFVRFDPRHSRDDYRSAAEVARAAAATGQTVWWAASHQAALYYRVPLCQLPSSDPDSCVVSVSNRSPGELADLPLPDVVIASKPDIFDRTKAIETFCANHSYSHSNPFMAFAVSKRIAPRD